MTVFVFVLESVYDINQLIRNIHQSHSEDRGHLNTSQVSIEYAVHNILNFVREFQYYFNDLDDNFT